MKKDLNDGVEKCDPLSITLVFTTGRWIPRFTDRSYWSMSHGASEPLVLQIFKQLSLRT